MKKLVVLFCLAFAVSAGTKVMAQVNEDQDDVEFNAHLLEVYDINVYTGQVQEITFMSALDYTAGVTEAGGIVQGYSDISVEATGDWNMTILCPDFDNGAGEFIPINNLGVWIENNGSFTNGNQVSWSCVAAASAQALDNGDLPIISLVTSNAGDIDENNYRFHWLMGTMQGNMNATSMFDQLQNGDFILGDYSTTAILTLWSTP